MTTLKLARADYPEWHMGLCAAKLLLRAQLPGASIFDRCSAASRVAAAQGLSPEQRLVLALPASWMVNNPMPSPSLQAWISERNTGLWLELMELMDLPAEDWPQVSQAHRGRALALVEMLHSPGSGLTGVTKVLAQLCPETVPLMDDAALWFALGSPAPPHDPNNPQASPEQFLPMVDWFTSHVVRHRPALEALAEEHRAQRLLQAHQLLAFQGCELSAAQVLDRLLWFESWGYHQFKSLTVWRWLALGDREAIIPISLSEPLPATIESEPTARHPWPTDAGQEWQAGTQELLDVVYEEVFGSEVS